MYINESQSTLFILLPPTPLFKMFNTISHNKHVKPFNSICIHYKHHSKFEVYIHFTQTYKLFLFEILDKSGSQRVVQGGILIPFNQVWVSVVCRRSGSAKCREKQIYSDKDQGTSPYFLIIPMRIS